MNTFKHLIDKVNNDDEDTRRTAVESVNLIYQVSSRLAIDLGNEFILKCGSNIHPKEVENMSMIRENTQIPIPNVIRHWNSNGIKFILMDKVRGVTLQSIWKDLKYTDKRNFAREVSSFILMMRNIKKNDMVLTHGDLIPLNIMVNSEKVLAIIDWETCSFLPIERELDIMSNNPDCPSDWRKMIEGSLYI